MHYTVQGQVFTLREASRTSRRDGRSRCEHSTKLRTRGSYFIAGNNLTDHNNLQGCMKYNDS